MYNLQGYHYLVSKEGVCGGRPTIINTRIEPNQVATYGTIEEVLEDFPQLRREHVLEAIAYYEKNKHMYNSKERG